VVALPQEGSNSTNNEHKVEGANKDGKDTDPARSPTVNMASRGNSQIGSHARSSLSGQLTLLIPALKEDAIKEIEDGLNDSKREIENMIEEEEMKDGEASKSSHQRSSTVLEEEKGKGIECIEEEEEEFKIEGDGKATDDTAAISTTQQTST
jgi:hypothetical protein